MASPTTSRAGTGSYTYGTIGDFARDLSNLDGGKRWQSFSQAFGPYLTKKFVRDFNFYGQDAWRVTNKLTLNHGLRYEYAQFAQPAVSNPRYPQTGVINQPGRNFAPRAGFAYSLGSDNKTVIRGCYGIMYARIASATLSRLHQLNGVVQRSLLSRVRWRPIRRSGRCFPLRLPVLTATRRPAL